jgi:peroxiredoxin
MRAKAGWRMMGAVVLAALGGAAVAQDASKELEAELAKLERPNEIISVEAGRAARDKLNARQLPPKDLSKDQHAMLLRLHVLSALAVGDSAGAVAQAANLKNFPETPENLRAAWLAAGAAGDAQLAKQTLDKLRAQGVASEKSLAVREARLKNIGQPAPDTALRTDAGVNVSVPKREGQALVLTFWKTTDKPSDKQIATLKDLYSAYGQEPKAAFVGVNSDGLNQADVAREFAGKAGFDWPQVYEGGGAKITKQFGLDAGSACVLIDQHGNVRSVAAASDPEFVYAVRAAVAEAKGEFAGVLPKTIDGAVAKAAAKPAAPPKEPGPTAGPARPEPAAQPKGGGDLPHDPEAARLLDQARLYLKTGKKTEAKKILHEIVEKYPGTWEARDAQERLDILGA